MTPEQAARLKIGQFPQHFHKILRFVTSLVMQSQERRPPMSTEAHIAASAQTELPWQSFQVQWKGNIYLWSFANEALTNNHNIPYPLLSSFYTENPNSQAF